MIRVVALAVVAVLAVGCGDKSKVGTEFTGAEGKGGKGGGLRDFKPEGTPRSLEATPTPTVAKATTPPPKTATQAPAATPQPSFEFAITAAGFEPNTITVYAGSTIKVTNKDKEPRAIREDKEEFESPLLQPGQSWSYVVDLGAGTYGMNDKTRNYIVGTLTVVAR